MAGLAFKVNKSNKVSPPKQKKTAKTYNMSVVVGMSILSLVFGIWIGSNQGGHTPSETPNSQVKTVTVTKTIATEHSVPYVPQSCKNASDLLKKISPLLERLFGEPNKQADIITQVKSAISTGDSRKLSEMSTEENTEHNNMTEVQQELMDDWSLYIDQAEQCTNEVNK